MDPRLDTLLSIWQERRERGDEATPAELCRDCPELADELGRRIGVLRQMDALMTPGSGPPDPAATQAFTLNEARKIAQLPTLHDPPDPIGNSGSHAATLAPNTSATAVPAARDKSPDGYEILGELGRGGMGVVYKARQIKLRRTVALKMILAGGHARQSELLRFRTEAEAIARLQHPHIVQIYEIGEHDGLPYFSLEFCAGGSLEKKLAHLPQPPAVAAALVESVARAVQVAHDNGVIHRDLKPANILLARPTKSETRILSPESTIIPGHSWSGGQAVSDPSVSDSAVDSNAELRIADYSPKITDFGLAKKLDEAGQTQTGSVMGTPSYMAPEQAAGLSKHVGPACDIYALGAILYEMLTGRPPFKAATGMDTLLQVTREEPVPPSRLEPKVPPDLETICLKCLRKEPEKRYASALELAEDLARFRNGEPVRARPTGQLERAWRWCKRNPGVAASLLALALALVSGTVVSIIFAILANDARIAEADHARLEGIAKQDADKARREAQRQLIELSASTGLTAAREGDHALALLWFTRAAQLAKDDPQQEELNRIRIANWLRQVSLPEGTFAIPGFRQNQDRFRAFEFSPDGNYLVVVATTGRCLLWDRPDGKFVPLPGEAANATAAAWQPRSNLLAVAEKSGIIRFLTAPDFQPIDEVPASGSIDALAFSRDSNRLAWGGSAGARVWDVKKKEHLTPLLPHVGKVLTLSFSSTGNLLATADEDSKARVFQVPSDRVEPLFPPVRHALPEAVYSHGSPDRAAPRFAANDEVLLTVEGSGGDDSALVWRSSATGKFLVKSVEGAAFAVNDQGTQVASLTAAKGRLFDGEARVLAPILLSNPSSWTEHAIFSADGQVLVTCNSDTRARFWSAEDRSGVALGEAHPCVYHPMRAVKASLSANGRHLAVALWDGNVYLWRLPSGPPMAYQAHSGGATVPALSPDKKFVMPRGISFRQADQLETRVYDAETGAPAGPTLNPGGILLGAAFSPDGTLVATASSTGRTPIERNKNIFQPNGEGGNIQIWDWKTGKRLAGPVPLPGEPRGLSFRPDGGLIAAVCADYFVVLIDPKTGEITRTLDPGVRSRPGNANQWAANGDAQFSLDGRFLVTSEMGPLAHVWEPQSGKLLHTLPHTERVWQFAIHPSAANFMATCGLGSEARVWNLVSGKLIAVLKHPQWVTEIQFSPDGKDLMTVADDGLVRSWAWQASTLKDAWALHPSPLYVGRFRFTADRRWLVSTGSDELQVTDWPTKTPVSPRWKTNPRLALDLEIPAGDRRVIIGGFSPSLVSYDLETMTTPVADPFDDLAPLAELAAGRRILRQGNIVPLNSAEWAERWEHVRKKEVSAIKTPPDADRQESQAWFNLGLALHQQDPAAAIDAYTKSLPLGRPNAQVWHKLALAQLSQGNPSAAAESLKKLVALEPGNAQAWFDLGNALRITKDFPEAVNAYKEAIAIVPDFAEAHCNLGHALKAQGDFVPALESLRKGHELGSRRPGWPYLSAGWILHCERLMAQEKRLASVLNADDVKPAECLALAELCRRYKKRYRDAARLYARAFTDESALPRQALPAARFDAACAALLAASGKGVGADSLTEQEKSTLRGQALDWLTTDLVSRRKLLKQNPLAAFIVDPAMEDWSENANLASVRDLRELANLPSAEQAAWQKLWADTKAYTKEIESSHAATRHIGTLTAARREQAYPLAMSAGKTYLIDMESSAFDTYLRLEDSKGKVLAEHDDISPENTNSRIVFNPNEDGSFRIIATSFERRGIGNYALTIRVFARHANGFKSLP